MGGGGEEREERACPTCVSVPSAPDLFKDSSGLSGIRVGRVGTGLPSSQPSRLCSKWLFCHPDFTASPQPTHPSKGLRNQIG